MDKMGLEDGEVIQSNMLTRYIEKAQKKVEENNFGVRKRLLEYDDVMNSQREVIYTRRRNALQGERISIDLNNSILDFADSFAENNHGTAFEDFTVELIREVAVEPTFSAEEYKAASVKSLAALIAKDIQSHYERKSKSLAEMTRPVMEKVYIDRADSLDSNILFPITDGKMGYNVPVNLTRCKESGGEEIFKSFSKMVMFTSIDEAWRQHLRDMDDLRQSVQNATYEQKDPLLIYKFESFELFAQMLTSLNRDVLTTISKAYIPVRQPQQPQQTQRTAPPAVDVNKLQASRQAAASAAGSAERGKTAPIQVEKRVGRNEPCPCGSGKKYKQCHGK